MQIPGLDKVVINMGIGEGVADRLRRGQNQRPISRRQRHSDPVSRLEAMRGMVERHEVDLAVPLPRGRLGEERFAEAAQAGTQADWARLVELTLAC